MQIKTQAGVQLCDETEKVQYATKQCFKLLTNDLTCLSLKEIHLL